MARYRSTRRNEVISKRLYQSSLLSIKLLNAPGITSATGELSQSSTAFPLRSSCAARSGRSVVWNWGNGEYHASSVSCSSIPLSRIPSTVKDSSRSFTAIRSSSCTRSSTYRSCTTVLERTPIFCCSTLRRVSRIRFRTRAALVFTLSQKPSLEPRSTFSVSASDTSSPG